MAHALRRRLIFLPALVVLVLAAILGWWLYSRTASGRSEPARPPGPINVDAEPAAETDKRYVGAAQCAECHAEAMQQWEGSHHDRAMEAPTDETVEGDFSGATFTKDGVTSRFFKEDGDFYVRTEGEDGERRDFKVAYTFGVYPLQQYLVEFPGGRLQTLPLCWDNRPEDEGGQRWFHIYDEQRIAPDDPLFWTRPPQNWNMQCAECHSTNLKKNYDPEKDQYHTTFAQIDVSCEACHGPGSKHVEWAEEETDGYWRGGESGDESEADGSRFADMSAKAMGLSVTLNSNKANPGQWKINPETGNAQRTQPLNDRGHMQICSRCHSLRTVLSDKFVPGESWLETHRPTLLEQPLYHSDGRIEGEVYVWGSFRQSKMYHKGVRCVDCHDPHSTELKLPKKQLCLQCHSGAKYATRDHHFHEPGSKGASCVRCHMPEETFMVVDGRRDHSFRIPRPDRSKRLGTPNTCNDCHTEKSYDWAAKQSRRWWGEPGPDDRPYADALDAAWEGHPAAAQKLVEAARDNETPTIAQATALARLRDYPNRQAVSVIRERLDAEDPLVRMAAVRALNAYRGGRQQDQLRWRVGSEALRDPSPIVRLEAARALAGTAKSLPGPNRSQAYEAALQELRAVHRRNSDRASTLVSRGNLERHLGRVEQAVEAYQTAMERNASQVSAYVNLADHYRQQPDKSEQQVQAVLKKGLAHSPDAPGLHHALAMSLVRQQRYEPAIERLKQARELGENNPRYAYMLAVAYNGTGRAGEAIAVLEQGLETHPESAQLLQLMATIGRDAGRLERALAAATRLTELAPDEPRYQRLRRQIERRMPGTD